MAKNSKLAWTLADESNAMKQGWLLANVDAIGGPVCCIQRYDERNRFPTDHSAAAYVVGRAEMGDYLAQKALKILKKQSDGTFMSIGSIRKPNTLIA